eukprot:jgi/Mesvir1/15391/Mv06578-RA.2
MDSLYYGDMRDGNALETFLTGGYYSIDLDAKPVGIQLRPLPSPLTLVVLNTIYYASSNIVVNETIEADPVGQLAWLDTTLARAEKRGRKVLLAGHLPPGVSSHGLRLWKQRYELAFRDIVLAHAHVISASVWGHVHRTQMRLMHKPCPDQARSHQKPSDNVNEDDNRRDSSTDSAPNAQDGDTDGAPQDRGSWQSTRNSDSGTDVRLRYSGNAMAGAGASRGDQKVGGDAWNKDSGQDKLGGYEDGRRKKELEGRDSGRKTRLEGYGDGQKERELLEETREEGSASDEWSLVGHPRGRVGGAMSALLLGPAVTPVYNNFPGFRVVTLDVAGDIRDFTDYHAPLTNSTVAPRWSISYTASSTYDLAAPMNTLEWERAVHHVFGPWDACNGSRNAARADRDLPGAQGKEADSSAITRPMLATEGVPSAELASARVAGIGNARAFVEYCKWRENGNGWESPPDECCLSCPERVQCDVANAAYDDFLACMGPDFPPPTPPPPPPST